MSRSRNPVSQELTRGRPCTVGSACRLPPQSRPLFSITSRPSFLGRKISGATLQGVAESNKTFTRSTTMPLLLQDSTETAFQQLARVSNKLSLPSGSYTHAPPHPGSCKNSGSEITAYPHYLVIEKIKSEDPSEGVQWPSGIPTPRSCKGDPSPSSTLRAPPLAGFPDSALLPPRAAGDPSCMCNGGWEQRRAGPRAPATGHQPS